jgi:hypothetical protein
MLVGWAATLLRVRFLSEAINIETLWVVIAISPGRMLSFRRSVQQRAVILQLLAALSILTGISRKL